MKRLFYKIFTRCQKEQDAPSDEPPLKSAAKNSLVKRILHAALDIHRLYFYFLLGLILLTTVECFARRSFVEGLLFPFRSPLAFLANYAIVLTTILPTLLLKRRVAIVSLVSAIWLGLGVTQFILLSFRVTPLTAVDFSILTNVFTIIEIYLTPLQIILISFLIVAALAVILLLFIKLPKVSREFRRCGISIAATLLLGVTIFTAGYKTETLSNTFPNIANAYKQYGFAYCFSLSLFDKGIDKPDNYEKEAIDSILTEIEANTPEEKEETPNVIFVQLESFFDVQRLEGISYSKDPLPNLTALKQAYASGLLTVPVIGAGTVNTEFEVLSGISVNHFGPGEYPYKSILKDETCETIAYTLAERGYTAHAIHNHQGTFYGRDEIYKNLGFSSFTPLEYMLSPEYNDTQWAKDMILIPEIFSIMESTEGQDFVFAVSVQGHGKYPTDYVCEEGDVHVTAGLEDVELISKYNYYLKQIHEMDAFVGALAEEVLSYDEPTVLVFYGDHLPSLSISSDMLSQGGIFETEYLILSNYGIEEDADLGDLYSYELYPAVMQMIGNVDGIVNKLWSTSGKDENYLDKLLLIEYDMLYGERYVYGGGNPPAKVDDMTLGTRPILLSSYEVLGNTLFVYGENFTPYSVVCLDGRKVETVFIDNSTLSIEIDKGDDSTEITVEQRTTKGETLSKTDPLYLFLPKCFEEDGDFSKDDLDPFCPKQLKPLEESFLFSPSAA